MSRVWFTDRDLFPPDGSDEQWLEHCGRNFRIGVTHNERIRYTPNELAAVALHRVALFVVVGKAPLAELASNFVNTLPKIERFIDTYQPPYIAKVYRPAASGHARDPQTQGSVTLWYPK